MKILFITDLYPVKDNEKTTPKTLLNFVKSWQEMGVEVDVVKPNFILNSFLRGKPFYKTGKYGNVFNINYWLPFVGNVKCKMPSILPSDLPNLRIVAHMPSGILFADKLGLPFIAGIHNSDLEVLTKPLYKFYFKKRLEKALKNAEAIACRSYVIEKKLLKLYPEFKNKTFVVPSGVELNSGSPLFCSAQNNVVKILTCANFKKRKNIDKLILACKDFKNVELTVIGDGKERKNLEKLDKNVKFTGWLNSDEVFEKMQKSDIFILPSTGETFGMVYLEAMASGCITVCSKDDGIDGIIKNGENGFLTEPTVEGIKNTLNEIILLDNDSRKLLRHNAFETIKVLTPMQCADNYLQQILKIL